MKKLANFYLCYDYKYDSNLREFVRIESPEGYLLSPRKYRTYKTKILPTDLPEWYVYGYFYKRHGYMSAKGVKYLAYRPQKHWNHMFKDDFLFVSYDKPITHTGDTVFSYKGHDELIYGGIIIDFLGIDKTSCKFRLILRCVISIAGFAHIGVMIISGKCSVGF